MRNSVSIPIVELLVVLTVAGQEATQRVPITLDELMISVAKDSSREVAYTNKQAGVFYTETNGEHRSAWQGWRIMSTEMMEDYVVTIDGVRLQKTNAIQTRVYPHLLVREYPEDIRETVTLLDSVDALVVELSRLEGKEIGVRPFFADSPNPDDYEVVFEQDVLLTVRGRHLKRTERENYPVWIGVMLASSAPGKLKNDGDTLGFGYSPAELQSPISNPLDESIYDPVGSHRQSAIVFVAADTKDQTVALAHDVAENHRTYIERRRQRMESLLNRSYVRTDNPRFDKALNWAKISLDALIMNQGKKGIFAGLPWFDNYWGRDTYISLPGATLVTGNFADAKEILRSFAEWQDTNQNSTTYGRIPNLVTTSSVAYNTADGTPRFVMALYEYVAYSGDTAFAREMYPVVKRSIDGTIKYHTDSLGFLTHGEAETWMDAVGPDGPWSPRGNRADDVQALWEKQLRVGLYLSELVGETSVDDGTIDRWSTVLEWLTSNFQLYFLDTTSALVYDHLNPDGSPDHQLRPNQIFTFDLVGGELAQEQMFRTITEKLVYPHGVASLSQNDENFHPYHHYAPYYVQDAAYHNGIVWTWLSGQWVDIATHYGLCTLAYEVTASMVDQILDRGAVGTMSELLDAAPRPGKNEPRLSGAYSQAWSLAEFVRNFYQSYVGVNVNAIESSLTLEPRLPSGIAAVNLAVAIDDGIVDISFERSSGRMMLALASRLQHGLNVRVIVPPEFGKTTSDSSAILVDAIEAVLPENEELVLALDGNGVVMNEERIAPESMQRVRVVDPKKFSGLRLATSVVRSDLKALKGPSHRLLTNAEIKQTNPQTRVLYDVIDSVGDDKGTGSYIYPQTTNLKPGSLDITHFSVRTDKRNVYFKLAFRNLSNPGWHPEYGFQLTYAAIAIDKDRIEGSGRTDVGMNAQYRFQDDFAYENLIYVGGGLRVVDDRDSILAEYLPSTEDVKNPLGDERSKTIQFSVPIEVLGKPEDSWRFAVLVGCQDDHGGAGIGEFRDVGAEAGEWVGGGKSKSDEPNVYDVILPKQNSPR